ncbi:hypothetical protein [Pontiella sulfatireligans]|uniref:Uncharacterized protein n=1 Tax=Pontiella sulfatireligans TaxID=2750658 RepID=A0A6C2UFM6_9BACT|nr:hypothetical protein [Pontiella sulfatireligans]VGO18231.1 hypothetical protein SCARR_00282 [Pontiella sulfatireligans]
MSNEEITVSFFTFTLESLKIIAGAFVGATAAFAFERRKKKDDEVERQKNVIVETQFALASRINFVTGVNKGSLNEHKDNPLRWIKLLPLEIHPVVPKIKIDELVFILFSKDANLLSEINLIDEAFDSFVGAMKRRNELHLDFQNHPEKPNPNFEEIMTALTDGIYKYSEDLESSIEKTMSLLLDLIKTGYKNGKGLSLDPVEASHSKDKAKDTN